MKKEIIYYTSELGKRTLEEAISRFTEGWKLKKVDLSKGETIIGQDWTEDPTSQLYKDWAKARKQMNKKTKKYKKYS